MTERVTTQKVRGEGHWVPVVDGEVYRGDKHDTVLGALNAGRYRLTEQFQLLPGEERLVVDIAKSLGVPRRFIEEIPDMEGREDYQLHVAEGFHGRVFEWPRKKWTLFREH